MNETKKIIERIESSIESISSLSEACSIASDFTPPNGNKTLEHIGAILEMIEIDLQQLLSSIKSILDRCGDNLFQDSEGPRDGGAE